MSERVLEAMRLAMAEIAAKGPVVVEVRLHPDDYAGVLAKVPHTSAAAGWREHPPRIE